MRRGIAARVAARLREDGDARVELVPGRLGEIRVAVDGRDAYVGSRLWWTRPRTILEALRRK